MDADGRDEIVAGVGPTVQLSGRARGFQHDGTRCVPYPGMDVVAFVERQGVEVAVGDADDDGLADVLAAPGPGPASASRFRGFFLDGDKLTQLPGYDVVRHGSLYGGVPGAGDLVEGAGDELVTAPGPDPATSTLVRVYRYDGVALFPLPGSFDAYPGLAHGARAATTLLSP